MISQTKVITDSNESLTVVLAEDAWQGDAQAVVSVDGDAVFSGAITAANIGAGEQIDLGVFDADVGHEISVAFTNDAWGGTAETDRNLYVQDVLINGVSTGDAAPLLSDGAVNFAVAGALPPAPVTIGTGPDIIDISVSEDEWEGDAQFVITVDGQQVGGVQTAQALHSAGMSQDFDVLTAVGSSFHQIGVEFINDAYGGTATTDRNLYVTGLAIDGVDQGDAATLDGNGTTTFDIGSPPVVTIGAGPDVVDLSISEDAWEGDAQFVVTVDGEQVGGVQTAVAAHSAGVSQDFEVLTTLGTGFHQIGVDFINDAYAGTPTTDRNLYVTGLAIDGVDQGDAATLDSNGTTTFDVGPPPADVTFGTGAQTILVQASEDAWQGDAEFVLTVDGAQVGSPFTVAANNSMGQVENFYVNGNFGSGAHDISVAFINDAYAGTPATDRNLYVKDIALDGVDVPGSAMTLDSNGSDDVQGAFPAATSVAPPPGGATPLAAGASAGVGLEPVGAPVYAAGSNVLTVGAGKEFQTISAAVAASHDGDVILVDAGVYTNDFAVVNTKISLIAVGGRVTMNATESPPDLKGILTEETDLTVVGFDFTNCRIPDADGHNGAGIRVDNGNLVLENDSFSGNQDGLLTNAGVGISVVIDHSVFNDNGGDDGDGAGNIHNVYIGDVASATVTNSVFENAQVGHEFKSRAETNILTNNTFISGVGIGTGSYDIDLPDGGADTVTDNTIIKGPNAENDIMVHFGGEGIPYAGSSLTVQNNLFQSTNPSAIGLLNQTAVTAQLSGNVLDGLPASSFIEGPAHATDNYDSSGAKLPDATLVGVLPGSTLIITDSLDHDVTLDGGQYQAVEGGAGLLTLDVEAGHIIAIGGTGGIDVTEGPATGGNEYTTVAGSKNTLLLTGEDVIDSEGTDFISAGDANQSAELNGDATVVGGAGNSSWGVNGTATIDTGSGSAVMTLGATATVAITGVNDFFELDTNGGVASWDTTNAGIGVAGSSDDLAMAMQVYNGTMNITTAGGAGGILCLDTGNAIVRSVGREAIYAGSGDDTVIVSGGAAVLAGTGELAVYARGGGGGANVWGTDGDYVIDGDSGGITYHGGVQASTVEALLSNIAIIGGDGALTVNGGSRDTITGGEGGLNFNDFGGGANSVATAPGSSNVLDLSGSDQVDSYGSDTIDLDSGNSSIAIYGNSSLTLGNGNSQVTLAGADIVAVSAGSDSFSVAAGADVSFTLSGQDSIQEQGAQIEIAYSDPTAPGAPPSVVSVSGGSAQVTTDSGSGVVVVTDGTSPVDITAGGPGVTVDSAGADSIHLGANASTVVLTGGGAEIWAGDGDLTLHDYDASSGTFTLHGGNGAITLDQGPSSMTFIGGAGGASLTGGEMAITGGSGAITATGGQIQSFIGGSGAANLSLGAQGSNIQFGLGTTVVNELGWGASNVFTFLAGASGADTIENFQLGTDRNVLGAGVSVVSEVAANGSVQALLSSGAQVAFVGLSSTQGLFG